MTLADWTWKADPRGGYLGLYGKVWLHEVKRRQWALQYEGVDYPIPSRKATFDHAEQLIAVLRRRGVIKVAYSYDRRRRPLG